MSGAKGKIAVLQGVRNLAKMQESVRQQLYVKNLG